MEITESSTPVTESDVVAFETRLGINLPTDYRQFLLEHNGGKLAVSAFRYKHETGPYTSGVVRELYPIYYGDFDVETVIANLGVDLPTDMIPIGEDTAGNQICLCVAGAGTGAVVYVELGELTDHIHLIADSFNEFLDSLFKREKYVPSEIERLLPKRDVAGVERLIESGWDINTPMTSGLTAIESCAKVGRNELVRMLVRRGARPGRALEFAIQARNLELMELLMEYEKTFKNKMDS